MSEHAPLLRGLRHPGEVLKELATETRIAARWSIDGPVRIATSTVIATGALFLGYYVITGAAGDYNTNQSPKPGAAAPEPKEDNATLVLTSTVISTPEASATPPLPEPPTPTASPAPDKPKPLPEVINNQTAKFVIPSLEKVKIMEDEAKAKGEIRLALPDIIKSRNLSVQEVHAKQGYTWLAITASEKGSYNLPVILEGIVFRANAGKPSNFSSFSVRYDNTEVYAYIFPAPGKAFLKAGEPAHLGQDAVSIDYDPDSPKGQIFTKFLDTQIGGNVPHNTIALLGRSKTNNDGLDLTLNKGLLQTPKGEIVLVGPSAK